MVDAAMTSLNTQPGGHWRQRAFRAHHPAEVPVQQATKIELIIT
jgi:hypothetical protein